MKLPMIITERKLRSDYGPHAASILGDMIKPLERKKKEMQKYQVVKELPGKNEFNDLRNERFKTTIGDLVTDAVADLESLRDELQSWYDNLPESFQQGDKGNQLEEAIQTLENISEPSIEATIAAERTVHIPMEKIKSRSDQRDEACEKLQAALDELSELLEVEGITDERKMEIDGIISEIESIKDEADGVEFPGMY